MYTTIIRGIPDLVLMLLIFFGGQVFINQMAPLLGYDEYIDINPFIAGVSTIGFIFGAYMTETFRGAILAVNQGQLEAGTAYGMSSGHGLQAHHPAPDGPPRPARIRQQLAGADQDHRAGLDNRP